MSNRLFNGMSHNHLGTNAGPEGVVVARVRHSHGRGKGAAIVRSRGSIIWETVVTVGVYLPSGSGLHSILVNREHHLRCQWLSPVVSTIFIYTYHVYIYIHINILIYISSVSSFCSLLLTFKKGEQCWCVCVCVAITSIFDVAFFAANEPRLGVPH